MKRIQRHARFKRFVKDISVHTPFIKMIFLLIVLWLIFSTILYMTEHEVDGASINT